VSPDGGDLASALRSLRELGRFDEAAKLARAADFGALSAALHLAAGAALSAVSDYRAAAAHLLMASADTGLAARALAGLAELAWIARDHDRGRAYALEGLAIDPSSHACRVQLQRNDAEPARAGSGSGSGSRGKLAHAAFFADRQGNTGDLVLTDAVRHCFRAGAGSRDWYQVHVHQVFDERRLAEVNAADALIVGGGGLFLPDTAPNGNSGWQWNVPNDVLRRIDVPLVVFAVGYNMFEGQQFSEAGGNRFRRSLHTLLERSAFVGLRNHGSVNRVRELLPDELADRVHWQPCPTTFLDLITPSQDDDADLPGPGETGAVLLNCAYDRAGRRFADAYPQFLRQLRDWVVSTGERAVVQYAAHCVDDERFVVDLRREYGISLPVLPMYDYDVARVQQIYRRAALVVGMRGHAGMIPFGCGTPILSLVSHPKLGYFLADIERPEWGVSIRDPRLGERLGELTAELLDTRDDVVADIRRIRRRLHEETMRNVHSLPSMLHPGEGMRQDAKGE
jgi:Polysaccharide pyruvyl transferase